MSYQDLPTNQNPANPIPASISYNDDDLEGYSGGIGFDFGGSRLDLAVNRTEQDVNELLFDSGVTNSAQLNRINTNVSLSYTLKF